ncbi:hypothetical protein ROZALSC1DRAFT_20851 [Rozella allomycis CSF55]|uniref:Uncharacterized protein n=1 Tax=Rozella allomycis (strain CSF55) TaxID=988480 RepID=A0A4P9YMW5_ROZAC|nr:hypothetical protein ROZALSC1DRAFT_20851 [Rozella allomycis CSF55]
MQQLFKEIKKPPPIATRNSKIKELEPFKSPYSPPKLDQKEIDYYTFFGCLKIKSAVLVVSLINFLISTLNASLCICFMDYKNIWVISLAVLQCIYAFVYFIGYYCLRKSILNVFAGILGAYGLDILTSLLAYFTLLTLVGIDISVLQVYDYYKELNYRRWLSKTFCQA